jgi:hypothetical protein
MMLITALVDRHFREARFEHPARFVPSGDETGDDRIDIVEVEGGIPASIYLRRGQRFGVVRYHVDADGGVAVTEVCGIFDTPSEAAACVVAVLRRERHEPRRGAGRAGDRAIRARGTTAAEIRRSVEPTVRPRGGGDRQIRKRSGAPRDAMDISGVDDRSFRSWRIGAGAVGHGITGVVLCGRD